MSHGQHRKTRGLLGKRLALILALVIGLGSLVGFNQLKASPASAATSAPVRAAFYYPWFPNAWTQQGVTPYTNYTPSNGYYNSADPAVVSKQIAAMQYGHLDAGIISWWGQGSQEDSVVPTDLTAANGTGFKWGLYYEPEGIGDPSVAQIQSDLSYIKANYANNPNYLTINGQPVIFVYGGANDGCAMADRWAQANATLGFYTVLKVFPGYQSCGAQPSSWHQYAPSSPEDNQGTAYSISPGFNKSGESFARLHRDWSTWVQNVKDMVASNDPLQLVTTFNEWGEGSAVESATQWSTQSGYGDYLDAMHNNIPAPSTQPPPTTGTDTEISNGCAYITNNSAGTNFNNANPLDSSHTAYRTLLQFPNSIPAGAVVTAANLIITPQTTGSGNYQAHQEPAFNPATVTWSNQPAWDPTVHGVSGPTGAGSGVSIPLSNFAVGSPTTYVGLDYSTPGVIAQIAGCSTGGVVLSVDWTTGSTTTTTTTSSTTTSTSSTTTTTTTPTTSTTTTTTTTPSTTTTTSTTTPTTTTTSTTTPPTTTTSTTMPSTTTTTKPSTGGNKVMVIMEENHSQAEALSSMPYLTGLSNTYGKATNYFAIGHPSLPNYLEIWGGTNYGTSSDCGVGCGPTASTARSVWDQTIAAGKSAKAYQEGMSSNCATGGGSSYVARHGPWPYWTNSVSKANCAANDVPITALQADINAGTLPVTGEITPNLNNDAHDGSLATADNWLKGWIPKLMAGPDYTSGHLTIIVVFDEDDSSQGNKVDFVAINPALHGVTVTGTYNHYSLTRWLEDNAGVSLQNNATTAANLKTAFGL